MHVFRLAAAVTAGLLFAVAGPTPAAPPKYQPTRIDFAVKGLEELEMAAPITKRLYQIPAVLGVIGQVGKVTVGVKPDMTLKASAVVAAVKAASTEHLLFEVDWAGIPLAGTCDLTLADIAELKDEDLAQALQTVPNVEKVVRSAAYWRVTFKAPEGATVGEVDAALKTAFGSAEAQTAVPTVHDVAWTAPKAPPGWKEGSHAGGAH